MTSTTELYSFMSSPFNLFINSFIYSIYSSFLSCLYSSFSKSFIKSSSFSITSFIKSSKSFSSRKLLYSLCLISYKSKSIKSQFTLSIALVSLNSKLLSLNFINTLLKSSFIVFNFATNSFLFIFKPLF